MLLPLVVEAFGGLRRRGRAGRGAAHGDDERPAGIPGKGLSGRLHLSGGSRRAGRRCRYAPQGDDLRARGRQNLDRGAGAGACRCRLHAGGFRLRAGAVFGARRHRRCLFLLREQALPTGFLRRRGRFDPAVQHFEPVVVGQAGPCGDHPRPECRGAGRGEGFAGAFRRRGCRLVVLRRRFRVPEGQRRAPQDAGGHGASRGDRLAADEPQRTAGRSGRMPDFRSAGQSARASGGGEREVLDGSPAEIQQELRDAGGRYDPQRPAGIRHLYSFGEQGAGRASGEHLPPDRPRAGRRAVAVGDPARGFRGQRPEAVPLHRPSDLRPLPALPHQRRDPARRADDRRRAEPAPPRATTWCTSTTA